MAIGHFTEPIGEFCVAINLAIQQKTGRLDTVSDADILSAYQEARVAGSGSKRRKVQEVARRLGIAPNRVYAVVEQGKHSVD